MRILGRMIGCRRNQHLHFLILVLVSLTGGGSSFAQSGAGSIQGTITDGSGAVVPHAAVHVVNGATAQSSDTTTNSAGFYSVQGLFAGNYTITFSAAGMKTYQTDLELQVAQTAVVSAGLSVGSISEKVTVTGQSQQLATYDNGTVSTDLDNARINQLPMNGRSILSLTGMATPGLESGGTRVNGLESSGLEYVQDGAPVVNRNYGGQASQADPDAIQEVKIETSSSNAMYATPGTAVITTKSGTNQLHGTFFETARNNALGIARSRANPSDYVAPRYIRNEFGASGGGPVVIPHLYDGKNRSFFFFAYERYSLRSGAYTLGTVPTTAERNGDFSGMVNSNGILQQIYDPATTDPVTFQRQPFANNQIPLSRISPLAKALFSITPTPTNGNNPLVQNNISYPALTNTDAPNISTRLDHAFNAENNAYLRYSYYSSTTTAPYSTSTYEEPATIAGSGMPANAANLDNSTILQHSAALGFTHIFSPTFVSQTVLGNIWETTWANLPPGNANTNYESQLGLPNNFGETGFPEILGPTYQFLGGQVQWGGPTIITNLDENLTKTLGKHQLFFGGRYRHERLTITPDKTADQFDFQSQTTGLYNPASGTSYSAYPNTGHVDADFFLGSPYYYANRLNPPIEHWRDQEFDGYIQDDYHMRSNLTFNLGLRWEAHPVATEKYNLINGFDMANKAVVLGTPIQTLIQKGFTTQAIITNLQNLGVNFETPSQAGLPQHMVYGNNAIFSPRLGVAYSPFGSGKGTVLRAGYGRYDYPIPLRNFYASAKTNEPFAGVYYQNYNSGADTPDGLNNYLLRSHQPLVAGQDSSNVIDSSSTNAIQPGVSEFSLNPHFPPNMVSEVNGTIEQPLKPNSVLRVSYVYEHSTHLDQEYEYNNAMSTYVWETKTGTAPPGGTYSSVALNPYDNHTYGGNIRDDRNGYANYHALQVNYQRLYKDGYAYQLSYVYARAMRVGGNAYRDSIIYPSEDYAPGTLASTDYDHLNRMQNYGLDTAIPEHHISFNGLVDLPVGRGKKLFGNANRFVDELIGGYQIAFDGGITSQYVAPSASNWGGVNPAGTGSISPIHVYKKKYKVTDCSSGTCYAGHLWYNGFISPLLRDNPCGASLISGLPASYEPYQTPINVDPGTITCSGTTAKSSNSQYLANTIPVQLTNGSTQTVTYSPGPSGVNPFSHTFLHGPFDWSSDISLFKVFPIKNSMNLRVNVDAFNAFNVQGDVNPGSNGIQYARSSYNTPRQIQLTARLTF